MTPSELDRLVERIGDEILARVGLADAGPGAAAAQPAAVVAAQVSRFDAAVASLIDHTLLRPDATREEIDQWWWPQAPPALSGMGASRSTPAAARRSSYWRHKASCSAPSLYR